MIKTDQARTALTPAQRSVVELPWNAKVLVTAGAGTGKTTTLVHRLEYLTREEELEAADVLVLSFSRTAVRELRERLDHSATSARRVRAQTFDSWASSLLYEEDPQRTDLSVPGFDRRIEMASRAIESGVLEGSERGTPLHVVVDEVQDLVGVRRELVETLLEQVADAGFTVVGDVAQSIYGFQIKDPLERAGEVGRFTDWVRTSFADEVVECSLDHNFRARTAEAKAALATGPALQRMRSDEQAVGLHRELLGLLSAAPHFGSLDDDFAQDSLRDFDGTTGLLCQDNGQVLHVSRKLDEYGIAHRIRRSVRDRPSPAWLAALFSVVASGKVTEDRFHEIVAGFDSTVSPPPSWAWRSLRRVAGAARNQLDLSMLRRIIAEKRLPDDLTAPPEHRLIISTIHRVKGAEFDRVVITEPDELDSRPDHRDAQDAARLLYVAMTRPRDDLYRLSRPTTWMYRKAAGSASATDRWYTTGRAKWMRTGVELTEPDVAQDRPSDSPQARAPEIQRYLRERVREGDQVSLRRLHDLPMSAEQTPEYGIYHDGFRIGEVSERFRRDLWRILRQARGGRLIRLPTAVTGVRVDGVETVAGPTAAAEQAGLGGSGVWLAPRLCGLGRIIWSDDEELPEGSVNP
ncbi:UvrD-helicase domain-containing protein [Amycolatopsis magusensis]|uniref:UvrD-helicase domain-containing protein n=1 Tax=Amycolatopsis magusensis TaxID=882444 RepID=UPI0024A9439F|nr:UvrD-helicase domain-containing protein [Amycolatopsis magusensis]MDI5979382.1 AAA family ATPase [Amycolatopsis magusensis]